MQNIEREQLEADTSYFQTCLEMLNNSAKSNKIIEVVISRYICERMIAILQKNIPAQPAYKAQGDYRVQCRCGEMFPSRFNYCPNCGQRIEGGDCE